MFRLIVALSVLCFASATLNQERIVNGRNANIMEVPYQVSIQTYGSHWCGGSVLTNRWCLTAAHCLVDIIKAGTVSSLSIRIGSSNWIYGGSVKKIEAAINHPNYNPETQDFDVGLLRTAQEIVYSGAVKPVTLITAPLPSGTPVVVSGWGLKHENDSNMPKDLQLVELKSMSRNECGSKTLYVPEQIKESMTCASGDNKDSCQGDSGGPLNIALTCCQVGIVSFGAGCAQPGLPGVYAALYHPLIIEFIKSYARDARFSTSCAQYQI